MRRAGFLPHLQIQALDRTQPSLPQHRHEEFPTFLRTIGRTLPETWHCT